MGSTMDATITEVSVSTNVVPRVYRMRDRAMKALAPATQTRFRGLIGDDVERSGILVRESDPSGISGTGDVAYVLQPLDGAVCLAWPKCRGIEAFGNVDDALECHGHGGQTYILWADGTTSGKGGAS